MKTKLQHLLPLVAVLLFSMTAFGQKGIWKPSSNIKTDQISKFHLSERQVSGFELNAQLFKQALQNAPERGSSFSNTIMDIPIQNDETEAFRIYEAPVFSASLQARYPQIKSYIGYGVNNPLSRVRLSVSPQGVQAMITASEKEALFVMPVEHQSNQYVLYSKSSKDVYEDPFVCSTMDEVKNNNRINEPGKLMDADDQTLRTYRLAVSVNGEYTQYHGGTVADALAGINATITRVNEVFETDMAINFELVDAEELIFTNPNTDPYSSVGNWNGELQNTLNNTIGDAAYDIGHMFGASGGGGSAGCIGCVCQDGIKGSGKTSPADGIPEGDNFDIDYVAHEIGHQMGANHTFAFNTEGTGVNSEPGSGTTIMAYAGITGADDVQQHSDPYFHYHSINQILNNVDTAPNNCSTTTTIANAPPEADAGNDYHIPQGTAYKLSGVATDPDGDALTYCWEQTDSGAVGTSNFGPTLTNGSMNRSLPPTTSPDRFIPKFSRALAGELTEINPSINDDWETVATVDRTMEWALTVRDREATATGLGGQTGFDLMEITVEDVPAFTVNAPTAWAPGSTQTLTWNVGETANATINCQTVNILFSDDNGTSFTELAVDVPNNGSAEVTVPNIAEISDARVIVEAADNIFYTVSNAFAISSDPEFAIFGGGVTAGVCGEDSTSYDFEIQTVNGFSETITLIATGAPTGSSVVFSPETLSSDGAFTMEVNGLSGVTAGNYTLMVTGSSPSITHNIEVSLFVLDGICSSVANTTYQTSTTLVQFSTIDNASGKLSGYSDYTDISTDVNREESYDLTVHMNTDGNYTCTSTVWIDWNQNCLFESNETYDLGSAFGTADGPSANSPLAIMIPENAVLGSTTMRVTTKYNSPAESCENNHDAEVEDYTINVEESLSVKEIGIEGFALFPNPNNGNFTVTFKPSSSADVNVEVFDIRGRAIFNNVYSNNGTNFNQTINLGSVQSGMYLVKVGEGQRSVTKKIVIE